MRTKEGQPHQGRPKKRVAPRIESGAIRESSASMLLFFLLDWAVPVKAWTLKAQPNSASTNLKPIETLNKKPQQPDLRDRTPGQNGPAKSWTMESDT